MCCVWRAGSGRAQLREKLRSGTEKQLVRELNAGMDRMEVRRAARRLHVRVCLRRAASATGLDECAVRALDGVAPTDRLGNACACVASFGFITWLCWRLCQASVAPYSRFVRTEMKQLDGAAASLGKLQVRPPGV